MNKKTYLVKLDSVVELMVKKVKKKKTTQTLPRCSRPKKKEESIEILVFFLIEHVAAVLAHQLHDFFVLLRLLLIDLVRSVVIW